MVVGNGVKLEDVPNLQREAHFYALLMVAVTDAKEKGAKNPLLVKHFFALVMEEVSDASSNVVQNLRLDMLDFVKNIQRSFKHMGKKI
mmetsp:Transcript_31084/g.43075  ORF Transcript_31084/g.43075 Transcript_31084/m.43075 type:complete len:88 (-) Transcript_31084:261-524(-)